MTERAHGRRGGGLEVRPVVGVIGMDGASAGEWDPTPRRMLFLPRWFIKKYGTPDAVTIEMIVAECGVAPENAAELLHHWSVDHRLLARINEWLAQQPA